MTDERKPDSETEDGTDLPGTGRQGRPIDRRRFIRGAAVLAVGASTTAASACAGNGTSAPANEATADATAELQAQTGRAQRWAGRDPANWVRSRDGVDHNVVIVGGGQSGVAISHGLRRRGVGGIVVIDQAAPGQAGIWRTIARMHQLRTAKTLPGLDMANPALGFRAWFETLNSPEAFDALDRIPRLAWADYLDWFQQASGTQVRYRTRLIAIEPQGGLLRLHLESEGVRREETTRKLVLANGFTGAGGPNIPGFLRDLPSDAWTHTTGNVPFGAMAGQIVGVVGAGSSAFDAAAVALESGASEVHMYSRRAYIDYPAPSGGGAAIDRGYAGPPDLTRDLPDVVRWRNFLLGERRVASVPLDSLERAVKFDGFRVHLNSSLSDVRMGSDGRITATVEGATHHLDHLIAGTGYRIDLSAQPELAGIHESVALWGHSFEPGPGEDHAGGALYPYLGPAFELQPRPGSQAEYLRHIHCFNLGAQLSFGMPVGDVPSAANHPRLIAAIAHALFLEGVDTAAHARYINAPLTPPDPGPYQRSVQEAGQQVA